LDSTPSLQANVLQPVVGLLVNKKKITSHIIALVLQCPCPGESLCLNIRIHLTQIDLSCLVRCFSNPLIKLRDLGGNFLQDTRCQTCRVIHELFVGHKLDDIPLGSPPGPPEQRIIGILLVHFCEICTPDPDNNNRNRKLAHFYNVIN
jgi:hypothetical protein